MLMWIFYLCFVSTNVSGLNLDDDTKAAPDNTTHNRVGKQLSVFTVVKFPNNAVRIKKFKKNLHTFNLALYSVNQVLQEEMGLVTQAQNAPLKGNIIHEKFGYIIVKHKSSKVQRKVTQS